MKQPIEIIAERIGKHEAAAVVSLLNESGWLILRHDAIRKAQADEREWIETGNLRAGLDSVLARRGNPLRRVEQAMQQGGRL